MIMMMMTVMMMMMIVMMIVDRDDDADDQAASGRSLHLMAGSAICFVAPLDHSQEVICSN